MPPGEDESVKLAVAVNDINWIKETMTDTRDAVKELSVYIKAQDEHSAKKEDLKSLEIRVSKLEGWQKYIKGALAVIVLGITLLAELFHNGVIK